MMFIEPPHRDWDRDKTAAMIRKLRRGKSLPPILIYGEQAYSGSHRIGAWKRMDMDIDYVEIDNDEYRAIMTNLGLDPMYDTVYDFEPFLHTAHALGYALNAR